MNDALMSVLGCLAAVVYVGYLHVCGWIMHWYEMVPEDMRVSIESFWHSEQVHQVTLDPCCDYWECDHG